MSDPDDPFPPNDPPPQQDGRFGRLASRRGASRADAVLRMENVRVTAPDLARRAALEKSRSRLVISAGGFTFLFGAVLAKLALATIFTPLAPHRVERPVSEIVASAPHSPIESTLPGQRAAILDRNGQPMAISLNTVSLFADPRQIGNAEEAAEKLKQVLPRLDLAETTERLKRDDKKFIYIAREITPREEMAVNDLGIPGIDFRPTQHRQYPLGRTAAQVLGGVDVDQSGFAGVEKYFDERLRNNQDPLRLSIDLQVQAAVREELIAAMQMFTAIGGCGIVMDVHTGEVLAMVSLPDYDANLVRTAPADDRFNRAVEGTYEPGSTFKLQTASMALDLGVAHIWDEFDASHNISIGRFTISDFEGKHRWLYLPEVLAYSSNLGAAHIAQAVGSERQRNWLRGMGMFGRTGIELPESARPIIQPAANWKEIATLTVGFGHGISVTPLHVVRGTAAIANGGLLVRPTILALEPGAQPEAVRVMQTSTSDIMRRLMRLVVTDGFGKSAEVPGYYPGGKTGTAEKVQAHGGYKKHANVAAFMSVFPMNAPRFAVYMMLDEPHATKATYGYATAGWVVAPAAGKVIARIAPMMGMLPDLVDMPAINQALAIPLQPGRPAGAPARGPGAPPPAVDAAAKTVRENKPNLTVPATVLPPAISRPVQDIRRQTRLFEPPPVMAAEGPDSAVMAAEGPPSTPSPLPAEGVDGTPARAMTGWADAPPPTTMGRVGGRGMFVLATSVAAR
nr:penicillin-binding protein 2 [uncultured Rhodopila sp.]